MKVYLFDSKDGDYSNNLIFTWRKIHFGYSTAA